MICHQRVMSLLLHPPFYTLLSNLSALKNVEWNAEHASDTSGATPPAILTYCTMLTWDSSTAYTSAFYTSPGHKGMETYL